MSDSGIQIESLVSHRSGEGLVRLSWGDLSGQLSPDEAVAHALAVIECAVGARIDATLVRWVTEKLGQPRPAAAILLQEFRQRRESGPPSCTMNFDGESVTPTDARAMALSLLQMAATSETEAILVAFLMQSLSQPVAVAEQVLLEFREMQGQTTLWPKSSDGAS